MAWRRCSACCSAASCICPTCRRSARSPCWPGWCCAYLLLTIGLGWLYFRWAGIDPVTSYFAAVPGNFSDMVILADQLGANVRVVALVHSARLVIAVAAISFGLRYVLGIDPVRMVISDGPPPGLFDLAVLLACAIGGYGLGLLLRLPAPADVRPPDRQHRRAWPWASPNPPRPIGPLPGRRCSWACSPASALSGVKMQRGLAHPAAVGGLGPGAAGHHCRLRLRRGPSAGPASVPAMLAFAPGGFAEISILSMAAGISLAFVTTVQLIRMVFTVLVAPMLIGAVVKRRAARQAGR